MSGTSLVSDSNKSTIGPCILSSILYHVFQQNLYCPSYQIFITQLTPIIYSTLCISLSHHNKQNLFYLPEAWLFYLPEFWLFYLPECWLSLSWSVLTLATWLSTLTATLFSLLSPRLFWLKIFSFVLLKEILQMK